MVLQPGNVMVVDLSPPNEEWFDVAVRTCHIRGWVEILHESIPTGHIQFEGRCPVILQEMDSRTMYRLTEGEWSVINRSHSWVKAIFFCGSSNFGGCSCRLVCAAAI